jgi:hypothetical protein
MSSEQFQGLGELTFLQLSTTYAPPSIAGHSVGCVRSMDVLFLCFFKLVLYLGTLHRGLGQLVLLEHFYGGRFEDWACVWELGFPRFVLNHLLSVIQ